MGQNEHTLVPMLVCALLAVVLFSCSKQQNNGASTSDKTISIQRVEPIISRMYYTTSNGLRLKNTPTHPKPEDLDYLSYWEITFKGGTDSLMLSCKGTNGELNNASFKYKFEDGFLKMFNPDKPLWETIGYGTIDRISFFVDYVVYRNATNGPFWVNLDFCPEITVEDALQLNEKDLFCTVSNLTLGNISGYADLQDCRERIYWRLIAYVLE
ncbi:MAG: hypothetical protein LBG19_10765 [Prevotellaceae bacterium]|nr:hypothetical protein [Prevotellaceae bacterium]